MGHESPKGRPSVQCFQTYVTLRAYIHSTKIYLSTILCLKLFGVLEIQQYTSRQNLHPHEE